MLIVIVKLAVIIFPLFFTSSISYFSVSYKKYYHALYINLSGFWACIVSATAYSHTKKGFSLLYAKKKLKERSCQSILCSFP